MVAMFSAWVQNIQRFNIFKISLGMKSKVKVKDKLVGTIS